MGSDPERTIAFDRFEIDSIRGELRRDGEPVQVEPKVLNLISHFARHPGAVLSREELIASVWKGRIVSDSAISSCIAAARTALGDDGTAQRIIRTVPRRGFRFELEAHLTDGDSTRHEPTRSEKPSVAVLPFQNMSGDPEQDYFSDGITDDIITELARYDELFVSARHSSFIYRDTDIAVRKIARELGVQYIAQGSVRRAGSRVRITVHLIDPRAGNELWAERYDREITDIFDVQDEITSVIVNTLAGQITRQHYKRSMSKSPEAVDAYDHVLRAMEHGLRISPKDNSMARTESCKAIEADPGFARAHAMLALTFVNEGANFWVDDPARSFANAYDAACAAVAADGRDPWAHAMLGVTQLWHKRAFHEAIASMQYSLELNPGSSYFRGHYAYVLSFVGQADKALDEIEIAIRMNPHIPALYHLFRGRALLVLRRSEEALHCLQRLIAVMPGHSTVVALAAVAYASAGRIDIARETVETLRGSSPYYTVNALRRYLPYSEAADRDFIVDTLRDVGLPE